MGALARIASALLGGLLTGLVEWWRAVQARSDAIALGRSETISDALEKAVEHERRAALENLTPPDRSAVDRRLRDGTF